MQVKTRPSSAHLHRKQWKSNAVECKNVFFVNCPQHNMYPGILAPLLRFLCGSVLFNCSNDGDLSEGSCGVKGWEVKGWHVWEPCFVISLSFTSTLRESVSTTTFPTLQLGAFTTTSKRCVKHSWYEFLQRCFIAALLLYELNFYYYFNATGTSHENWCLPLHPVRHRLQVNWSSFDQYSLWVCVEKCVM